MKEKILIFGLGRQGYKYYQYFQGIGYDIVGVNSSGKSELLLQEIYSFTQFLKKNISYYRDFSYIIVSVFPISEQGKVIEHLLQLQITNKCIIEKPVCYNTELLQKLINKENYTFFVDEIILSTTCQKLFPDMGKVCFDIPDGLQRKEKPHLLQHVFGGFLLFEKLDFLSENINESPELKTNITHFRIRNNKYTLVFKKSDVYLNKHHVGELKFSQKIESVILFFTDSQKNIQYKNNFSNLIGYLNTL